VHVCLHFGNACLRSHVWSEHGATQGVPHFTIGRVQGKSPLPSVLDVLRAQHDHCMPIRRVPVLHRCGTGRVAHVSDQQQQYPLQPSHALCSTLVSSSGEHWKEGAPWDDLMKGYPLPFAIFLNPASQRSKGTYAT
jgi:hypothetical protein